MDEFLLKIDWQNRSDALAPVAVIAFDEAARRLRRRLLTLGDEQLAPLHGVYAENVLFAAGPADALPWADGVVYLGKDAQAPSIYLPTSVRPAVPLDLFEKSLLRRFADRQPFAVVGDCLVGVGRMRPVSRRILSEIL